LCESLGLKSHCSLLSRRDYTLGWAIFHLYVTRAAYCMASLRSSSSSPSVFVPLVPSSQRDADRQAHHLLPSEATAATSSSHSICGLFTYPAGPFGCAESSRPLRHRVPVCSTGILLIGPVSLGVFLIGDVKGLGGRTPYSSCREE